MENNESTLIKYKNDKHLYGEMLGALTFFVFCASTVFMVFFSISAIANWVFPWNQISILLACLLPLIMAFIWKILECVHRTKRKFELKFHSSNLKWDFLFIGMIVFLGLLNIFFSGDRPTSFKAMTLFLISGIGVFMVAIYVLNSRFRQKSFLFLCWVCLAFLSGYGISELDQLGKRILTSMLFSLNPIPAGSLLILLLIGPLLLFPINKWWLRVLLAASVLFCMVVIFYIGQRGPLVALFGMSLVPGILLGRKFWVVGLLSLILICGGYYFKHKLPLYLQRNLVSDCSTTLRVENYFFAVHVFKKKPFFGTGLRASLYPYLPDYKAKFNLSESYSGYIGGYRTLENAILLVLVEMGGLFATAYFLFLFHIFYRFFRDNWNGGRNRTVITLFLCPLVGFFLHSMTFDSLMYPHLNWLFHSLLGFMVNFEKQIFIEQKT